MRSVVRVLLLGAATLVLPAVAHAHPHAWIDMRTALVFDDRGRVAALKVHWTFDEFYTLFATEGMDRDGDGEPDAERLQALADTNVANLAAYSYFSYLKIDGAPADYVPPLDYGTEIDGDGRLTLRFTLPLLAPPDPRSATVTYAIYDPTYYIQVLHVQNDPIALEGPVPDGCDYRIEMPNPSADTVTFAASLDQTQSAGDGLGELFAEKVVLACAATG